MVLVEATGNGSAQKLEHLIAKELIFGLLIRRCELLQRCCKLWIKPRCCSDGLHRRRQKDCGFSARAMLLRYCMKTPFKFLITDVSFLALRHGVMVFAAPSVHSNRRLLCPIIVPMFICFWAPGLKEGGAAVGTQIGLGSLTSVCWDRVCRCLWGLLGLGNLCEDVEFVVEGCGNTNTPFVPFIVCMRNLSISAAGWEAH